MSHKTHTNSPGKIIQRNIVFLVTISLVLITSVTVIFPALLVRASSQIEHSPINPWDVGPLALPLVLTNIIFFGIIFMYRKNKLPALISRGINYIFDFEVSKKISLIAILVMIGIYIFFTIDELGEIESGLDSPRVVEQAENWSFENATLNPYVFRFFLLSSSIDIFDNIRVIPFIASISLVILTFFITLEISKKRFAGLVAAAILLQSFIFLKYDTRSTYENFWTLFYILSLYLVYKAWQLSAISFVLSIFSKPLSAIFLPVTLFFVYNANMPRKKKIYLLISYGILISIGLGVISFTNLNLVNTSQFDAFYFWQGFTSVAISFRFDYLVILFLIPLTVGLYLASKRGIFQADSILVLISGILLSAPLLTGFTDLTNQPYRFIPLVVFFAMGVGTILSNKEKIT